MSLSPGTKLGHFEILEPIGRGGMGEVYRAKDSKLGRDVAIKVLPDEFAQDEERLRRFQREAKVLASLNHPNIAAIYGLEQSGDTHYLVLELVPGETLADRIARGPIPVAESLEIAKKIAEAFEEAHEQGIVHRDLKPANVKLTPDDKVKVLDFGLAKAFAEEGAEGDTSSSMSPTITRDATRVGVILGTAAYMSPEQAKGKRVDKRADIWAFGVVLYEMLAGRRAFAGDDVSEVLAAVIKLDPAWDRLAESTPASLRRLMRKCLEKDRAQRLHDIADARIEIDDARTSVNEAIDQPTKRPASAGATLLAVGAVGCVALGGLLATLSIRTIFQKPTTSVTRFAIMTSSVFPTASGPLIDISADGRTLVYSAERDGVRQLFLHFMDRLESIPAAGTEGAETPSLSPNGKWVVFTRARALEKISTGGGPSVTICKCGSTRSTSWGAGDTVIFTDESGPLSLVPASGGPAQRLTDLEAPEVVHRGVSFLPNGKGILFAALSGSRETSRIIAQPLPVGERRELLNGTHPRYVPTGHLVFARSDALWAAPFDVNGLRVTGEPMPVVEGVRQEPIGAAQFDISDDGTLVYLPSRSSAVARRTLMWVGRDGTIAPLAARAGNYRSLGLSPSGDELVLQITDDNGRDNLWLFDIDRGTLTPVTDDDMLYRFPVWAPDGSRVAFGSGVDHGMYWMDLHRGNGPEAFPLELGAQRTPTSWSHDGRLLAFEQLSATNGMDIFALSVGDGATVEFRSTRAEEGGAVFSPDSKWIVYESDESGGSMVYVSAYPDGRPVAVSSEGGREPRWGTNGSELFYVNEQDEVVAVSVRAVESLELGRPRSLFRLPGIVDYDVHADGRFIVLQQVDPSTATNQINVVLNWTEELKRLVPTN